MSYILTLNQLSRLTKGSAELGAARLAKSLNPKNDLISKGKAICTYGNGFIEDMLISKEISGTKFSKIELLTLLYGKYIHINYGL